MAAAFINYRRDETALQASWLRSILSQHFGPSSAFKDTNDIPVGTDFEACLALELAETSLMLSLIGPGWAKTARAKQLTGEKDYAAEEVCFALARGVMVIPVLVGGATTAGIEGLATIYGARQAVVLRDEHFEADARDLIARLESAIPDLGRTSLAAQDSLVAEAERTSSRLQRWMEEPPRSSSESVMAHKCELASIYRTNIENAIAHLAAHPDQPNLGTRNLLQEQIDRARSLIEPAHVDP